MIFFDGFDQYDMDDPEDAEAFYEKYYGQAPEGDDPEIRAAIEGHFQEPLDGATPLDEETEPYLLEYAGSGPFEVDADTVELHLRMDGDALERNRGILDSVSDAAIPPLKEGEDFSLFLGTSFSDCDSVIDKLEGAVNLLSDAEIAVLGHSIPDGLADKLDRMSAAIRALQARLGTSWYRNFATSLGALSE